MSKKQAHLCSASLKYVIQLNPLPIDTREKVCRHVDAIFGAGVSDALPDDIQFSFSRRDRKSTRLNSSHANISYAVFCLKKKHPAQPSRCRLFFPFFLTY